MIISNIWELPKIKMFDKYLWVDYFELLTMESTDKQLTYSNIKDYLSPTTSDLDSSLEDESVDKPAEVRRDRFEAMYSDFFQLLSSRQRHTQEAYPFAITGDSIELSDDITDLRIAYIYLLFCSSLRLIDKSTSSILTSDFEKLSCGFLKKSLNFGESGGPHVFGKNSDNTSASYQGNAFNRLNKLANDIAGTMTSVEREFPPTSTGDSGIDIVGWHCPWDNLPSRFVYVGQCKCSDDWVNETDAMTKLQQHITLNNHPVNLYFIPFYYRIADGNWHVTGNARDRILVDRLRMLKEFPIEEFKATRSFALMESYVQSKKR